MEGQKRVGGVVEERGKGAVVVVEMSSWQDRQTDTNRRQQERDVPSAEEDQRRRRRVCGWLAGKLCVSTVAAVLAEQVVVWLSAAFGHEQQPPTRRLVEGPCLACRSGNRKWKCPAGRDEQPPAVHAGQHSRATPGARVHAANKTPRHPPRVSPSIETSTIAFRGHRQDLIRSRVVRSRYRSRRW